MEANQIAGAEPQIRQRQTRTSARNWIVARWSTRSSTMVRSGCAWRLLPKDFGPWQTVYGYFRQWSQDWTWTFIHDTLRDWLRKTEGRNVAPTAAIIDSQSVKTARSSRRTRLRRGQKDQGPQTPRGRGHARAGAGHYDYQRRNTRSRRRQEFDQARWSACSDGCKSSGLTAATWEPWSNGLNNCGPLASCIWKSCGVAIEPKASKSCPSAGL